MSERGIYIPRLSDAAPEPRRSGGGGGALLPLLALFRPLMPLASLHRRLPLPRPPPSILLLPSLHFFSLSHSLPFSIPFPSPLLQFPFSLPKFLPYYLLLPTPFPTPFSLLLLFPSYPYLLPLFPFSPHTLPLPPNPLFLPSTETFRLKTLHPGSRHR